MLNAVAASQSYVQAFTSAPSEFKNKALETQFVKSSDQDLAQKKTSTALEDSSKGIDQSQGANRKQARGEGRGQFVDILA